MQPRHSPRRSRPAQRAFTLVELMIAVVVVALLASIALPSFMDSIRKSRRSEGIAALMAAQQAQERWRGNNAAYASALADLNQPATTPSGYYGIAIVEDSASATGYVVTATAVSGTSQALDGSCKLLAVRMLSGNVDYGSGASSADWDDPARCWAR